MRLPKLINDSNRTLIIIMSIFIIGIWIMLAITFPKYINVRYEGIKYQAGNTDIAEPISIEIIGRRCRGLFREYDRFEGKIMIDDLLLDYTQMSLWINKDKSASLYISGGQGYTSTYGSMSIKNNFEKITIQIYEQVQNAGGWSSGSSWLISAPCSTRDEAVRLSNELLPNIYRNY